MNASIIEFFIAAKRQNDVEVPRRRRNGGFFDQVHFPGQLIPRSILNRKYRVTLISNEVLQTL